MYHKPGGFDYFYNTSSTGLPNDTVNDMLYDSFQNCYWIATNGGLVKTDFTNWTVFNSDNSGIPENRITCLTLDGFHNLWLGTKTRGVAMYDGTSFTQYTSLLSGLTDNRITDIFADEQNDIWIGTYYGGLCRFKYGIWVSSEDQTSLNPEQNHLEIQVSPNPATTNAQISLTLPKIQKTTLVIYNSLGKKVKTLFDGNPSSSQFSLHWNLTDENGNDLPPAIYLVTVVSGRMSVSKRIVILR